MEAEEYVKLGIIADFQGEGEEAIDNYTKAANMGSIVAVKMLCTCYSEGYNVVPDPQKIAYWRERGAELGDCECQYYAGANYYVGYGVEKDEKKAVYWWQKAAEMGDKYAQTSLGNCYAGGGGVEKDLAMARFWWLKAAEQDFAEAQYLIGESYFDEVDVQSAILWWQKAAKGGNEDAKKTLKKLKIDLGE